MISYSGIVNYGKSTLPSVESWNTNNNIVRDPPRSVTTRRVVKVGDTSAIAATMAESDDRLCENINHYARGVNPMVSVTYGEGQTRESTSSRGQAFLPYRVVRDGAFRPPIQRPEDLLPLSRLPRNWTTVDPRPFEIDFTKRMYDCGTAETTREVRTDTLRVDCETRKIIAAEPGLTAPTVKYMLRDPLAPGANTNPCDSSLEVMVVRPHFRLADTRPLAVGRTNASATKETPIAIEDVVLRRNHPLAVGRTNASATKETPIAIEDVVLRRNHPLAVGRTNASGPIFAVEWADAPEYERLFYRAARGGYDGRPGVPPVSGDHARLTLNRVR